MKLWQTLNLSTGLVVNSPTFLVIKFPTDLVGNLLTVLLVNFQSNYWSTTDRGDYFIRVSVVLASKWEVIGRARP
jgi:hypothetical protein